MKLGLSMWSYVRAYKDGRIDVPGFVLECQRLGVDGVELLDYFWKDARSEMPIVLEALERSGLPCCVYSTGNNFAKADERARKEQVDRVIGELSNALQLRAPVVRVFAGDPESGIDFERSLQWIVDGLSECSHAATQMGLRLALENHGLLAGRSDQVREIIERVRQRTGTDTLGANPDTGNFMLVHEDSVSAVRTVASYAYMVHFKDFTPLPDDYAGHYYASIQGKRFGGTAIGEGAVDLQGCVDALRAAGFDGFLNIEYEAEEDPFTGVPRSVSNARRYVPAPS